jgi:hypothetical protein
VGVAAEAGLVVPVADAEPEAVAEQQVVGEAEPEHAGAFEGERIAVELQVWERTVHFAEGTTVAVAAPAGDIAYVFVSVAVAEDAVGYAAAMVVELLALEQEVTEIVVEEACEQPVAVGKASPT